MLSSPSHLALCCHVSGLMQFPDKLASLMPCAVFAQLSLWFSCKAFLTFQYPSSCSASLPWLVPLCFFTVPCWAQSFPHCIAKMWSLECFATEPLAALGPKHCDLYPLDARSGSRAAVQTVFIEWYRLSFITSKPLICERGIIITQISWSCDEDKILKHVKKNFLNYKTYKSSWLLLRC